MAENPDDELKALAEKALETSRNLEHKYEVKKIDYLVEYGQNLENNYQMLINVSLNKGLSNISEETKIRRFIINISIPILMLLAIFSIAVSIYSIWLPLDISQALMDHILKIDQVFTPIITAIVGYYFGSSSKPRK